MTMKVALMGAGGKMGGRIADNLMKLPDRYQMAYVEVSEQGIANLARRGLIPTPQAEALADADAVILALPDRLIGKITREIVGLLKPGAMVVSLDPAAAYAEVITLRDDLTYYVTHPCHPPMFNDEVTEEARTDWFGGVKAKHHIVSALHRGPEAALNVPIDFVDICTHLESHFPLAKLAAERKLSVVCQKPMATTLEECEALVNACKSAGVPLYINENWRWQYPLRQLKRTLDAGRIGTVFRARIDYRNSFPVFDNQPFLKDLQQFILTDIGSHILDTARFLFGDTQSLYCQTCRVHPEIQGEDVATVMLQMESGATVICDMSYATRREHDRFPETYVEIEGTRGFLELGPDFWVRETTPDGTFAARHKPRHFGWADPAYDLVHSSIVPAQVNIARALKGLEVGETSGEDNLKTMRLVFKSYESAAYRKVIQVSKRAT